jgi:hypothetical protein
MTERVPRGSGAERRGERRGGGARGMSSASWPQRKPARTERSHVRRAKPVSGTRRVRGRGLGFAVERARGREGWMEGEQR